MLAIAILAAAAVALQAPEIADPVGQVLDPVSWAAGLPPGIAVGVLMTWRRLGALESELRELRGSVMSMQIDVARLADRAGIS